MGEKIHSLDSCIAWNTHNTLFGSKGSVIKLLTFCIRRCLVSRASDWVMSAISVVLLIFSFRFRSAFLPCRSAMPRPHNGVIGLPNIGHQTLLKIWVGFWYGAYGPGEWFWIDSNGKKTETGHPREGWFGSEFRAICNHCVVVAAWSRKTISSCEIFLPFF